MLGTKFSKLVGNHSSELATRIVQQLQRSPRTWKYRGLDERELTDDIRYLLLNLDDWLANRTDRQIHERYSAISRRRASQGIPSEQLLWAIVIAKDQIIAFLRAEAAADGVLDLFGEVEFLFALSDFFDQAIYDSLVAYKQIAERQAA